MSEGEDKSKDDLLETAERTVAEILHLIGKAQSVDDLLDVKLMIQKLETQSAMALDRLLGRRA